MEYLGTVYCLKAAFYLHYLIKTRRYILTQTHKRQSIKTNVKLFLYTETINIFIMIFLNKSHLDLNKAFNLMHGVYSLACLFSMWWENHHFYVKTLNQIKSFCEVWEWICYSRQLKFWIKNCNIKYFDNKNVTLISNKKLTEVISSVEILNQEFQYKVHTYIGVYFCLKILTISLQLKFKIRNFNLQYTEIIDLSWNSKLRISI